MFVVIFGKHLVLRWYWTNFACDFHWKQYQSDTVDGRNPAPTRMYKFYIISYQPQLFSRISSINSNCLRCRTNSSFILKVSDFIVMSIVSINHNFIGFVLVFGGEGGVFWFCFCYRQKDLGMRCIRELGCMDITYTPVNLKYHHWLSPFSLEMSVSR